MVTTHKYKDITWIDLESPTSEELVEINKEYDISPRVANELQTPSERPRVDTYKNYMYLILHFPRYSKPSGDTEEIDFVIGKHFLITTHYGTIDSLHEFANIFDTGVALNRLNIEHAGHIFVHLIKKIYEDMDHELIEINSSFSEIEARIFDDNGSGTIEKLSKINRELIDFTKTMRMHREILTSFEKASVDFFGKTFEYHAAAVIGTYERVWHVLESDRDVLSDLRQTSDSLFSARTNSIMRTLTVLTFITIPLSIIANFGQNAKNIPIIGNENDFWIILALMMITAFALLTVFKLKKWL